MLKLALDYIEARWKVGGLVVVAGGMLWIGWNGRDMTLSQLDRMFFSDAQAQTLEQRFDMRIKGVEAKVAEIGEKVESTRRAGIESEIFKLRVEACMHAAGALRTQYEEQITKLIAEWRMLANQPTGMPPIPTCGDLGQ